MNKNTVKSVLTSLLSHFPLKRRILLESNPDLACNVYPVFEKMLHDPFFDDIELLWLVRDSKYWQQRYDNKNVRFVDYDPENKIQKLRAVYLALTSKCILFCNKVLWEPRKDQLSLFLGHGSPIKKCKGFYSPGHFCNRWSFPSPNVKAFMEEELDLDPAQGVMLGYPRNDTLHNPQGSIDKIAERNGKKVIFWLPTFRQHTKSYSNNYTLGGCGLPLLSEPDSIEKLNDTLEKAGVLLLLKPHPVQDMSVIRTGSFSSFKLISDSDLQNADLRLYDVLADADALLTDYSSVYYDYLLTNKPIGLTLDDLKMYGENRGLIVQDIRTLIKGRYLYTLSDLEDFIGEISRGEDTCQSERAQALERFNSFTDGESAQRVADYIRTFFETGNM